MKVLRISAPPADGPKEWQWALVEEAAEPLRGRGSLPDLARLGLKRAERIQVVLPAASVLITRTKLPPSANRRSESLLAYAVEETTASEPDANEVSWIGSANGADVLAVVDRKQLGIWRQALGSAGIHGYGTTCESLLLPWRPGSWSCAWNGREGFVRAGEFEGAATDCGERQSPPLCLVLMLEAARSRNEAPAEIDLYPTEAGELPDIEAWQRALGIAVRPARRWDCAMASPAAGVELAAQQRKRRVDAQTLARLRPAAWIAAIALAIHAMALAVEWGRLATEQKALRTHMESRFRSLFPDALAVADPGLQMRRKLAEARRAANKPDEGDFAVMLAKAAAPLKTLPAGALRAISYESGRMTLEFAAADAALPGRISEQLVRSGFLVAATAPAGTGKRTATLTLRAP